MATRKKKAAKKLPWQIVNITSTDKPALVVHDKAIAEAIHEWDDDVLSWNDLTSLKERRIGHVAISLSLLFSRLDDIDRLLVSDLRDAVREAKLAREKAALSAGGSADGVVFAWLQEVLDAHKGKIITVRDPNGAVMAGRLHSTTRHEGWFGDSIDATLRLLTWDGNECRAATMGHKVYEFDGERSLRDLGINLAPTADQLQQFAQRGRRIVDIGQRRAYVYVQGVIQQRTWGGWEQIPATGRAVVDPVSAKVLVPNTRLTDLDLARDDEAAAMSEDDFALVSPYLVAFSMEAKKWGRVHVDQISNIEFRTDALAQLVLPDEDKRLVLALVRNVGVTGHADFISGKGGGCVLLLHGRPGLGKTLTAEAIAEHLKRPLYSIKAGELGTEPSPLEHTLTNILHVAERWGAVLLLDEADVFMEQRQRGDIHRNAMVGVFLRLLEYYNGVLILTTNRVRDIDIAFYSRVSLPLYYAEFDHASRAQVTRNLLALSGITLSDEHVACIAALDVNGRQIKSAIRQARGLALEDGRQHVVFEDIEIVLRKMTSFQRAAMSAGKGPVADEVVEDLPREKPGNGKHEQPIGMHEHAM